MKPIHFRNLRRDPPAGVKKTDWSTVDIVKKSEGFPADIDVALFKQWICEMYKSRPAELAELYPEFVTPTPTMTPDQLTATRESNIMIYRALHSE